MSARTNRIVPFNLVHGIFPEAAQAYVVEVLMRSHSASSRTTNISDLISFDMVLNAHCEPLRISTILEQVRLITHGSAI